MSDIQVFKVPMNEINVHPKYIRCRAAGQFDVKVPIGQVSGIRKNWMGLVELETSGGKTYKISMGKHAKDCVEAIENSLYG